VLHVACISSSSSSSSSSTWFWRLVLMLMSLRLDVLLAQPLSDEGAPLPPSLLPGKPHLP
jgi:hypothetical protein